MSDPFDIENERIEIRDDEGNDLVFRPLAVIGNEEERYYVFGAVKAMEDEQTRQLRLMLVRREEEAGSAARYVVCENEEEFEEIIGSYLTQAIAAAADHAAGEEYTEEDDLSCETDHLPGEFCYCGLEEYLQ